MLDDSIGCAVWFAARGQGILGNGPERGKPVISTSRVGGYYCFISHCYMMIVPNFRTQFSDKTCIPK